MNSRYKYSVDVLNEYGDDINEYQYERDNPQLYQNSPTQNIIQDDNAQDGFQFQPVGLNANDIPVENQSWFPSLSDTYTNTIPDNYESAVMQFYSLSTDIDPFDTSLDVSFNTLYYLGLGGLGGKYVTWQLGREKLDDASKKSKDMEDCLCDHNHGSTFLIDDLLNNALAANFRGYPPIFTQAKHPGCKCSLIFNKSSNFPNGASDIPDSCPSVPITDDINIKNKRKQEIFNAIPDYFAINSATHPPLFITTKQASTVSRKVFADDSTIKMNRPIRINKKSIAVYPFGFWQAIPEGALGFILNVSGQYAEIFYIDYLCKVKVKRDSISIIDNLISSSSNIIDKNTYFIMSEGKVGALCYNKSGKYHAYFPDLDKIKEVSDITVLDAE